MQSGKPVVLVLMGGPDAEREISLLSGAAVAQALRESGRFDVCEHTIDRPTTAELASPGCDVVFPALHGRFGEGGPLQRLLEVAGLPYVGSGPAAATLAMDKQSAKRLLGAEAFPVLPDRRLDAETVCDLEPPLVLKPVDDGSSVDLRICRTTAEVTAARLELHPRREVLMAERYVQGREVTVGIVAGNTLPLIEIVPAAGVEVYDYQAKYFRDDTRYIVDPDLSPGIAAACTEMAVRVFDLIGCLDVARADFIVGDDGTWFLEINTMPGFTTHSLVPMAAAEIGLDMPTLCASLVDAALERSGYVQATQEIKTGLGASRVTFPAPA